jgi:DNA-binding transcriptional LysR family regulator
MRADMQLSDRIGRRMKLQDLHVLMTVVRAGTMGKAAALLNTGQPAISRSIAELEHALGVRLLDRHRQGIAPTAYGRALLDCGVAVFDDLRQGVKNIEFLADPTTGEVRIGASPLAGHLVSTVIDRLSRRYPRIVFHVVATEMETLRRELSGRNLDLLITSRFSPVTDQQFAFETLYEDSYVVVAGAQSPWSRRRRIKLAELMDESWALPPSEGSVLGAITMEAFRANGLDYPRVTVVAVSREVRTFLLATGRFLTILPTSVLSFERAGIRALPVKLPMARVPIGIVTLRDRTLNPATLLFMEQAREVSKLLGKKK